MQGHWALSIETKKLALLKKPARNWGHHKVLKAPEIWLNWAQWRSHKEREAQWHCPVSSPTRRYPSSLRHVAHQDLSLLISLSYIPHSCVQHSLLSSQFQDNLLSLILINEDNTLLLNSINSLLAESIFSWFLISDHIPPTTIPQITGPH